MEALFEQLTNTHWLHKWTFEFINNHEGVNNRRIVGWVGPKLKASISLQGSHYECRGDQHYNSSDIRSVICWLAIVGGTLKSRTRKQFMVEYICERYKCSYYLISSWRDKNVHVVFEVDNRYRHATVTSYAVAWGDGKTSVRMVWYNFPYYGMHLESPIPSTKGLTLQQMADRATKKTEEFKKKYPFSAAKYPLTFVKQKTYCNSIDINNNRDMRAQETKLVSPK